MMGTTCENLQSTQSQCPPRAWPVKLVRVAGSGMPQLNSGHTPRSIRLLKQTTYYRLSLTIT